MLKIRLRFSSSCEMKYLGVETIAFTAQGERDARVPFHDGNQSLLPGYSDEAEVTLCC